MNKRQVAEDLSKAAFNECLESISRKQKLIDGDPNMSLSIFLSVVTNLSIEVVERVMTIHDGLDKMDQSKMMAMTPDEIAEYFVKKTISGINDALGKEYLVVSRGQADGS